MVQLHLPQHQQHQYGRGQAWNYRSKRRKRDRSHDFGTPKRQRRSRRIKILSRLLLVVASSVAILTWLRHHPEDEVEGVDRRETLVNREDEEARLRREVAVLEDALLSKKALLGVAPGLPLAGGSREIRGSGAGGGSSKPNGDGGGDWSGARGQQQGQQEQRQYNQHEMPSGPKASLSGDAMVGGLTALPLRLPLESQPSLIREPVPLIVGGTDGSGTRGVVALLQRLKVPMVVEDLGTMDVHGAPYMAKGGWPMVVRPVIEWSQGTSYEPRAAPDGLRITTLDALDKLKAEMQKLARRLPQSSNGETARYVSWGFKAPVSMALVPFFEEAWGKVKFLHAVRDGRDIAFSGNQTPVEKFYAGVFPKGSRESGLTETSLKAMALWNKWNLGVHHWATSRKETGASRMDYLLLHAEDVIDPAAKFAAIQDVAEFVGSPLSDFDLCCIATEDSKDMGSHTKLKKDRGQINNRYGKWKGKVEGNPQLSKLLHAEGKESLRTFGYEPERSLRASVGFQCPPERDPTCPDPPKSHATHSDLRPARKKNSLPNVKITADAEDTATCVGLKTNMDFHGFDLKVENTEGHLECCEECRVVYDCSFFTFDNTSKVCYLKSGKGTETAKDGLVSGMALAS